MAAIFDINGDDREHSKYDDTEYGGNHRNASEEEKQEQQRQRQGQGQEREEEQVTKIYAISKIYPDPKDGKGRWYDQNHDLFYTGAQGKTDGYRYNIGRKDNPLDFEILNFQFAGYFKINKVTHLEDSGYKAQYPEADIDPGAKNREPEGRVACRVERRRDDKQPGGED